MAEATEQLTNSSESEDTLNLADNTFLCDPCKYDGDSKPAVGFCVDCDDFLCDTCYKYHCTPKQTRNHKLQDGLRMPKEKGCNN